MENQDRSNDEWKIKRGAMMNGKSREEQFSILHCSSLDFPFFIAPLLIFDSSLLLS
jgi:hypothetical protein